VIVVKSDVADGKAAGKDVETPDKDVTSGDHCSEDVPGRVWFCTAGPVMRT
jgi:hypothetical protein